MITEKGIWKIREQEGKTLFQAVLAGDVCPQGPGTQADWSAILSPLSSFLGDAELRIVQWETPLAEQEAPIPKSGPNLNNSPESAELARAAGYRSALAFEQRKPVELPF